MSRPLRWGILSTARIGTDKVIPALQQADGCAVVALASRDGERAAAAAAALGIPRAHGSYAALLADPDVDAIYNPLPNHLHVPLSVEALEAGKHVLCEKPLARSVEEAQVLVAAAEERPHLRCMEAFMYRFHPQWRRVRALLDGGAIGRLVHIHTVFSYFNDDPDDIRNQSDLGGGGLLDIGCYPISLSRHVIQREPLRASAQVTLHPEHGVDTLASAILDFGGVTASFTCSTRMAHHQEVSLHGERGRIVLERPFNPPLDQPCRLWHQRDDGAPRPIELDPVNQYRLQGEAFARAVFEGSAVPTPLADGVANLRVIEAIHRAAADGTWARIEPGPELRDAPDESRGPRGDLG